MIIWSISTLLPQLPLWPQNRYMVDIAILTPWLCWPHILFLLSNITLRFIHVAAKLGETWTSWIIFIMLHLCNHVASLIPGAGLTSQMCCHFCWKLSGFCIEIGWIMLNYSRESNLLEVAPKQHTCLVLWKSDAAKKISMNKQLFRNAFVSKAMIPILHFMNQCQAGCLKSPGNIILKCNLWVSSPDICTQKVWVWSPRT